MKRLNCKIKIGKYVFKYIHKAVIEQSWDKLTGRCTIVTPRTFSLQGELIVAGENALFKRGDKITVQLGYDDNLKEVFSGFVSKIRPDKQLTFECEDNMYLLKQKIVNKSFKNATLVDIQRHLTEGTGLEYTSNTKKIELGKFRIKKSNASKVLEHLRKEYGLYSCITKEGKLFTGLLHILSQDNSIQRFRIGHNIISSQLEYRHKDDVKLKVKAVSILKDNSKIEFELGDEEGELRTLHHYDLNESQLKTVAENEVNRLKYSGYRGGFTTFGEPFLPAIGDIVQIDDYKYGKDRVGEYKVKGIIRTYGLNGYRQEIIIDRKVA